MLGPDDNNYYCSILDEDDLDILIADLSLFIYSKKAAMIIASISTVRRS